ncbi:MAG: Gfo/Idh/MocA family oxidoreductase, partial [Solirubrobacteraceae bacterium]
MRVGILGVAHLHVDAYVENLRNAGVEIAGVYDWDAERGSAWARDESLPFFSSAEALVSDGVDGVIVCSETVHHRAMVETAAAAGAAVLCEKPLGVGPDDSE